MQMRIRRLILPVALTAACMANADGAMSQRHEPTVIPRFTGRLDAEESSYIMGMPYRPSDHPVAWTPGGELIVAHGERYASGDVVGGTCSGSGFFAVREGGGTARSIRTGAPACYALTEDGYSYGSGSVVYSARVEPNNSVLVRLDLATGRTDTLRTACPVYLEDPAVSPDGTRIAARGLCGRDQEEYGLYLMNADGSGLRELFRAPWHPSAAWSPDGRRLVVTRTLDRGVRPLLSIVDTSGREERALGPGAEPSWSPDGAWIAYLHTPTEKREHTEIRLMRADGTETRTLFRNEATTGFERGFGEIREGIPLPRLVWSPDSRHLAFSRRFERGTSVWRVEVATGTLAQVTAHAR
jgi:Tol biopolymer transport system component